MKTFYLSTVLTFIIFSCKKSNDSVLKNTPITKTIIFNIKAGKDFTGNQYDNKFGQVRLYIDSAKRYGSSTIIFDTTIFLREIKQFNSAPFPYTFSKTVANVLDSNIAINVGIITHYETHDGVTSPTEFGNSFTLPNGNLTKSFDVLLNY